MSKKSQYTKTKHAVERDQVLNKAAQQLLAQGNANPKPAPQRADEAISLLRSLRSKPKDDFK